ncbi:hypothetical protein AAC387_Pa05g3284 [Persea americana]
MPLTKTIALPPGPNPFRKEYPSLALLLPFPAVWLWHSRKEVCALPSWKLLPALTAENIQTLFFFEFPNETLIPSHLSLRLHIGLKAFGNYLMELLFVGGQLHILNPKFAHRKYIQRWCNKKGDITCEIWQPGFLIFLELKTGL